MTSEPSQTGTPTGQGAGAGELVLVATPIGNLGDLSPRALAVLTNADVVYCEDTRHSRVLFSAHGLHSAGRLQSMHEHNEAAQTEEIARRVRDGQLVALICDAGTPGISDPGARVVAALVDEGLRVTTVPGPSAVIAAITVSGLPSERFVMEGFLPRKAGERDAWYRSWAREARTIVAYESPQRVAAVVRELAEYFPERRVAIVRELTKVHEEVIHGTLRDVAIELGTRGVLGEVVLVLEGAPERPPADEVTVRAALADQFANGASTRDAAEAVSELLGVSRRDAYELALDQRGDERR